MNAFELIGSLGYLDFDVIHVRVIPIVLVNCFDDIGAMALFSVGGQHYHAANARSNILGFNSIRFKVR